MKRTKEKMAIHFLFISHISKKKMMKVKFSPTQ